MKINKGLEISDQFYRQLENMTVYSEKLGMQFRWFSMWCKLASKPIVLIIDEVDSASNNQVFLDFFAQLRGYYLARDERPTFRSGFRDTPFFNKPWSEFIFFKVVPTAVADIESITFNSTSLSAIICNVHLLYPSGASEQASFCLVILKVSEYLRRSCA